MKFATIRRDSEESFILGPSASSPFYLWSDLQSRFGQDKLVSSVETLTDFIDQSSVLLPFLEARLDKFEGLPEVEISNEDFSKAFEVRSFRDFYAFEEHVKNGRKSRGLEMIPEWYEFPVFYYSNHLNIKACNEDVYYPDPSKEVDFEMELACIVGRTCRNLNLDQASSAIFGFCLLNDFSARDFQRTEMKMNLGPAKGKDFGTSMGPVIYSYKEFENLRTGKFYDLNLQLKLNSELVTESNAANIYYSFEEMLVRASAHCDLYPRELIGSGTLGRGCLMELNQNREDKRWLKKGDLVELSWSVDQWSLRNRIV